MRIVSLTVAAIAMAVPASHASAERIFGLTAGNRIVTFDSASPGVITSSGAITGIVAGDSLTGLDLRPVNRTLYSVGVAGNVYSIVGNSSAGYVATVVGNVGVGINGKRFGIDFNPVPDRLRFVTDLDQNLRINPNTAVTIVDAAITGPGGSNLNLVGAAYTNSRPGASSTTLYGIDALTSSLVRSTNPNAGTYSNLNTNGVAFGGLGFNVGAEGGVGFDISGGSGFAYLSRSTGFYRVDLMSGGATLLGQPGLLVGITAGSVPEPRVWALAIIGFGAVGISLRRRRSPTVVC